MAASVVTVEADGPSPNDVEVISVPPSPPRSRLARMRSKLRLRGRFTASDLTTFKWTHILFLLNTTAIILWSVLLAGCRTPSLHNLALLTLSYNPAPSPSPSPLQPNPSLSGALLALATPSNATRLRAIAVGFTATCAHLPPDAWTCGADLSATTVTLPADSDPLNLLWIAEQYRTGIAWYGLTIIAIALTGIATTLLTLGILWTPDADNRSGSDEGGSRASSGSERRFPTKRPWAEVFARPIFVLMGLAFLVSFISAIWQHMASAATLTLVTALTYDTVEGGVGGAAMALAWVGALLALVSVLGTLLSILSRQMIDEIDTRSND
ncbi:Ca2+ regulator and membrane fusion protein Fig1-domain-containing protein [Lasiosphaeris hirsuta]|uniref:Ca2+ regulator and membrane fusion protein Fig1-domain-containing protein n=1 Tax=Lasiosphaeris hirsuta TaxID=260670 RepID=A0AA39ZXR3_9PEZI|nr:Ca2+ regulator and membrane fusion protein Fig1-domain-containing protein [Lasiosphaeris hirsuta]